jgi:colanic acid biosynthesis glycosyl transferase WcaI
VGKPTVMVGPADAECSRIVSAHGCGIVVNNGDAAGLAGAMERLRCDAAMRKAMGDSARSAFEKHFDRPIACAAMEEVLRSVVE